MKSKNISHIVTAFIFFAAFLVLDPAGGYSLEASGKTKTKKEAAGSAHGKSDLPFIIDCSRLDSARQAACYSYIAATRDRSYPILREMTSTALSKCYDAVYYTILPGDPSKGAGGCATGNKITYNQRYSLDLEYPYDTHELLHSISACNGALDNHVFHGPIANSVYSRLGVHQLGYFQDRETAAESNRSNFEDLKKSGRSISDLRNTCGGILCNQMTILYFDLGEQAIKHLYQSTIAPSPSARPNKQLTIVWGQSANQVQALLETLRQEYKYKFSVPACGF